MNGEAIANYNVLIYLLLIIVTFFSSCRPDLDACKLVSL